MRLLQYMGIPYIQAAGEAEVLCAELCRRGIVDAVGSADLDCIANGAKILVKNLGTDKECIEINHAKVLQLTGFSNSEFIDLCILLGCDYVDAP